MSFFRAVLALAGKAFEWLTASGCEACDRSPIGECDDCWIDRQI